MNSTAIEKNKSPKVSIGMPVFNGERFLSTALNSLLGLDYDNYEIIILDNMSSDKTEEICLHYSRLDSRIRYIRDEDPCTSHEAALRLAKYATGDYLMLVCDDDIWDPSFLMKIMGVFEKNDSVHLVYPRFGSIDSNNKIINRSCGGICIDAHDSLFKNFFKYLFKRSCVPLVFGVFRLDSYRKTLPFKIFDNTLWDADNLYLLKFLSNYKVHCVDESLFYYREKDRFERPEGSTDALSRIKLPSGFFSFFSTYWKHQINFIDEIFVVINESSFPLPQKLALKFSAILSMFVIVGVAISNRFGLPPAPSANRTTLKNPE